MKAIITGIGLVAGLSITAEQTTKTVEDMLKKDYDIIDTAKAGLRFKIASYRNNKNNYKNFEDYCRENPDMDKKIIITLADGTTVSLYGLLSQLSNGTLNPLHTQIVANHYETEVISFEEFKSMYKDIDNAYLSILANISRFEYIASKRRPNEILGIYAEVDNKKQTKMYIQKDGATNTSYKSGITLDEMVHGAGYYFKGNRLHFKANCSGLFEISNSGTVHIERMLAGLHNAAQNRLIKNYMNYVANVMDGSANPDTAEKLGIEPYDFSLDNIEWCIKDDNDAHIRTIQRINKKYNRVYAISALDPLWTLDPEWITLTHLDTYYRRVK